LKSLPWEEYHGTVQPVRRRIGSISSGAVRWGDRWTAGEAGPPVLYRHHACGETSHVEPHCAKCDRPMHATDVDVLPGPGARP
jgi:hypothetical protein